MVNNLNNLLLIEIYGQKYSVIKLVPLRIKISVLSTDNGEKRWVTVTPDNDPLKPKNFLMSYALISPEFWIDRDSAYPSNEVDFGFNIKDLAVREDFIRFPIAQLDVQTEYFSKDKILADEIITFPEIDLKSPLMWTYWDTPQSNPTLEFKSTNRAAVDYDVYFTATLLKLHIIPDDLIEPEI